LPEGVNLDSIQALPDGGMTMNASFGGFYGSQILSYAELGFYLDKIVTTPKGGRVDIGQGVYFQV